MHLSFFTADIPIVGASADVRVGGPVNLYNHSGIIVQSRRPIFSNVFKYACFHIAYVASIVIEERSIFGTGAVLRDTLAVPEYINHRLHCACEFFYSEYTYLGARADG